MPQNCVHMWPVHVRYNYGKFSLYMCCFWALIITYCSDLWCYWLHGVLCKSLYHWYTLYCTSDDSVVLLGSPSPAPPCKKQYILSLSPSLSDLFLMSPLTLLIQHQVRRSSSKMMIWVQVRSMIKSTTVIHSPIYSWITSGYAFGALMNLLMTEMERSQVCTLCPHGVCENATLLIWMRLDFVTTLKWWTRLMDSNRDHVNMV